MKIAIAKTDKIQLKSPFDLNLIRQIKEKLPGRKWHPEGKYWTCLKTSGAAKELKNMGFILDKELQRLLPSTQTKPQPTYLPITPKKFGKKLYPFQRQGVGAIEQKNGRILIADQMGLGKTIQALAWLQHHPEKQPVIIICPASVKLNWAKEIRECLSPIPTIQVLSGSNPYPLINSGIIIINYDIVIHWQKELSKIYIQVLILDECQYIKGMKTKRTKAVQALIKGSSIPHIIALSGTPVLNRPIEIFNAIKLISPSYLPNYWDYARRYCDLRHNGFGWNANGASNTNELHEILTNSVMIRRLKKDVLKELPTKTRSIVPIELDNQEEYKLAESDFSAWLAKEEKPQTANMLAKIEALKQLAVRGKLEQALDWIADYVEENGKLVVFTSHVFTLNKVMEKFADIAVQIDGSTPMNQRQEAIDKFQGDDNIRLFVGNVKAAGTGITLTAASSVVFLELAWTPGELDQAEDRIHRIGQEAEAVNIYYLLANDSIEISIAKLLDKKRHILDSVLDGKLPDEESLLSELITQFKTG